MKGVFDCLQLAAIHGLFKWLEPIDVAVHGCPPLTSAEAVHFPGYCDEAVHIIRARQPARFEVVPDLEDLEFSEGGPRAWFAVVRRTS